MSGRKVTVGDVTCIDGVRGTLLIVDTVIGLDGNLRLELRLVPAEAAESSPDQLKPRVRYERPPFAMPSKRKGTA